MNTKTHPHTSRFFNIGYTPYNQEKHGHIITIQIKKQPDPEQDHIATEEHPPQKQNNILPSNLES